VFGCLRGVRVPLTSDSEQRLTSNSIRTLCARQLTTKPPQSCKAYTSAPARYRCITSACRGMGRFGAKKGLRVQMTYQKSHPAGRKCSTRWIRAQKAVMQAAHAVAYHDATSPSLQGANTRSPTLQPDNTGQKVQGRNLGQRKL
jgi:hypothetical protein